MYRLNGRFLKRMAIVKMSFNLRSVNTYILSSDVKSRLSAYIFNY